MNLSAIDPSIPPSGDGCVECEHFGGWWFHLRRCAECGHIGCCDQSIGRHATAHFHATGHRYIRTFEPDENWFWDYVGEQYMHGPALAPPESHPRSQPAPGPARRVPADWEYILAVHDRLGG
jgi:Zn-finger in ubiquitin-hydrolases and other protein